MSPFIVTYFCGPIVEPTEEALERAYREVADAGFNLACPPVDLDDPVTGLGREHNLAILDVCSRIGLPYIVSDDRMKLALGAAEGEWQRLIDDIVEDYSRHPALYGYYIHDEPHAREFRRLGDVVGRLRARDPQRLGYINLFPNYASAEQLGADTYEAYVERYMEEVKPALLSYDHYHFLGRKTDRMDAAFANERDRLIFLDALKDNDRAGFFDNLEVVRRAALRHGVPFKIIVLVTTHGPYRDLTEAEIRWEVYQSLAYGTAGISYFTYWTYPGKPPWNFENGIVSFDGRKTAHYEEVRRINAELAAIGPLLGACKSLAVYHIGGEKDAVTSFDGAGPIAEITGAEKLTIGLFDQGYAVLANKDYEHAAKLELRPAAGFGIGVVDKRTGAERPLPLKGGVAEIALSAGDGELIRLYEWN